MIVIGNLMRRLAAGVLPALLCLLATGIHAPPARGAQERVAAALSEARADPSLGAAELAARLAPLDVRVIGALRAGLLDRDAFVRERCALILTHVGDAPTHQLLGLLGDPATQVRQAAEDALVGIGAPAVPGLGERLLSEPPGSDAKVRAARALGRIGDPRGLPPLLETEKRFRRGGFPTDIVYQAIAGTGAQGVSALLHLLGKTDVQAPDVYRALLSQGPSLRAGLAAPLADESLAAEERMLFAVEGEKLLGTAAFRAELARFFQASRAFERGGWSTPEGEALRAAFRESRWRFEKGGPALPPSRRTGGRTRPRTRPRRDPRKPSPPR